MSHHVKVRDLREKSKEDLLKQLGEFKKELSQLRVSQQVNVAAGRLARIRVIRKGIARVMTVLNKNERESLRKFYSDKVKKNMPKALRPKLTHRRRLALKPSEKNRRTRREVRMAQRFPKRVYAVKI
ncbi:putative Ribosomal L29 protein [Trypanosoma vivax]|uniref:Putative 60S ribosomal protein L35 n=1 Tax=Trypanosoma vivax (strain Y486) TaxID=1055687 RepID=G0U1R8_TRYVY|nr:putative Ribosomal L29 protein [Trypanosoma vivax]KAH8618800.1 putative Ribosomal L29 protein [Trypanosoma vivax]CCC50216.1 putative 60S ribosomal protein L35 [Trypanosoma vivax Y486]CCC50217.1 putative 60S ribosomal protein L35 [Trypanosoma vivax Y486]